MAMYVCLSVLLLSFFWVLSVLKRNSLKIDLTQQANLRIKIDFDEFRVVIPGDEGFVQISL